MRDPRWSKIDIAVNETATDFNREEEMSDSTVKGAWIQSTAAIVAAIIGGAAIVWVAVHEKNGNPQAAHEVNSNSPQTAGPEIHGEPDPQKRRAHIPTPAPINPNESVRPAPSDDVGSEPLVL